MGPPNERGPASQPSPKTSTVEEIVNALDEVVKVSVRPANFWSLAASGKVAGRTWTSSDCTSTSASTTSHSHSASMRAMEFNLDLIERRERRRGGASWTNC